MQPAACCCRWPCSAVTVTHLPGQEKCSQTLGCLSWRPLQSYMPVVFFGLAGTLLDLLNGKCSSRMAGWEGSIKPAAEPAARLLSPPPCPRLLCFTVTQSFAHAHDCPLPRLAAGYDKCKSQRDALEGYMRSKEAFGRQPTSLERQLGGGGESRD